MWDIWEALEKWIPDTSSVADVGEKGRAKGARTCGIVADNVTGAVLTRENAKPGRRRRHIPLFCDDGRRLRGLGQNLWYGSGGSRTCVEDERVVRSKTTTTTTITTTTCGSLLVATGIVACDGGMGRQRATQYASGRVTLLDGASKGEDTGEFSKEGPGGAAE